MLADKRFFVPIIISAIAYVLLLYGIDRSQFWLFVVLNCILFGSYLWLYAVVETKQNIYSLIKWAFFFRLLLIPAIPNLSDDFYRFYWDGLLAIEGISPFAYLPSEIMKMNLGENLIHLQSLFKPLNSPDYYSVYPPVLQLLFATAASIAGPNNQHLFAMVLKTIILLFEAGTALLLLQFLKQLQLPKKLALLYALNPLVIFELTGNIHFEAIMIFFVLLAFYLIYLNKQWLSAFIMGLAFATKILPLIFLPFLIKRIGFKNIIVYGLIVGFTFVILLLPFADLALIKNIGKSVGLYYNKFEFNASVYYLLRAVGYQIKGYNWIAVIGKLTAITTMLSIFYMAYKEHKTTIQSLFNVSLFALTLYLLLANIVHPWYIAPLVAFAVIAKPKYAIVWSLAICLSYFAYSNPNFKESFVLIGVEYLVVLAFLVWEVMKLKKIYR